MLSIDSSLDRFLQCVMALDRYIAIVRSPQYISLIALKLGDLWRHCGGLGIEILMPYPINQRAHQFNSIQSVSVSFGLWDTTLKFLSPGPRNDVTDHLEWRSWSPWSWPLLLFFLFFPTPTLRKHPFSSLFVAGDVSGINVCDSATEIPYWWREIGPESGHKRWLDDGEVTLS